MEYRYFERKGFTFSEVLITLGIIGVVAVLTLTTVIPEIQNKQNIAKWKKEYSVINNAFNEVLADGVTICEPYNASGDCKNRNYTDEFLKSLAEKLRVVDYCGDNSYVLPDKVCDNYYDDKNVKYKWVGIGNNDSRFRALGVKSKSNPNSASPYGISAINFNKLALLLNDGAVVYFGEIHGGPWIVVDVNNYSKGPNEFGKDVFVIKLLSDIKRNQHSLKAMGVEGTFNKEKNGNVCECSPNAGVKTGTYLAGGNGGEGEVISGVCCSAKYLME